MSISWGEARQSKHLQAPPLKPCRAVPNHGPEARWCKSPGFSFGTGEHITKFAVHSVRQSGDEAPAHFGNWPTEASLNSEVPTEAYLVKVTQNPNCRACKRGEITSEQYKVWNDGLSKMREGMLDHEIERRTWKS